MIFKWQVYFLIMCEVNSQLSIPVRSDVFFISKDKTSICFSFIYLFYVDQRNFLAPLAILVIGVFLFPLAPRRILWNTKNWFYSIADINSSEIIYSVTMNSILTALERRLGAEAQFLTLEDINLARDEVKFALDHIVMTTEN